MTRIALFLSALPLAAILALVLNHLLERASARRAIPRTFAFLVGGALLVALATAPGVVASIASKPDPCASADCALTVDRHELDEFWSDHQPKKVKLIHQSPIPISVRPETAAEGSLLLEDGRHQRPPEGSPPEHLDSSLETLRP